MVELKWICSLCVVMVPLHNIQFLFWHLRFYTNIEITNGFSIHLVTFQKWYFKFAYLFCIYFFSLLSPFLSLLNVFSASLLNISHMQSILAACVYLLPSEGSSQQGVWARRFSSLLQIWAQCLEVTLEEATDYEGGWRNPLGYLTWVSQGK